jgi:hypothetical protein
MPSTPRSQQGTQHPDEWRADLNPGHDLNVSADVPARSAYDVKAVHRRLAEFEDDELKRIPVLAEGVRLRQGATYLDLGFERPRVFTATADMVAPADRVAPKDEVDYELWNRLERLAA